MKRKNNSLLDSVLDLDGDGKASLLEIAAVRHALKPVINDSRGAKKTRGPGGSYASAAPTRKRRGPSSPFRSAYRAPGSKGLGELTYSGYSKLRARVMRGIVKNILLSILLVAVLFAVIIAAFSSNYYDGNTDVLLVCVVPVLCIAAIMYIAIGVYNDVKSDLEHLRREKKCLSRSAAARMERQSGRRGLSLMLTLAASAAALIVLNMVALA